MDASLNAAGLVARLRGTFDTGRTRDIAWRREQLEALRRLLREGEGRLIAAIAADFSKPAFETQITETRNVVWEIDHALPRLARWMRGHRTSIPWALWPGSGRILPEPLGVAADHRAVELSGAALCSRRWSVRLRRAIAPCSSRAN